MSIATDRLDQMVSVNANRNYPLTDLKCICNFGPDTDGPSRECPEHGDVRWYAGWLLQANADRADAVAALRAVLALADRLDGDSAAQKNAAAWLKQTPENLGDFGAAIRHAYVAQNAAIDLRAAIDMVLADHGDRSAFPV